MKSVFKKNERKAFSMIEVTVALVVLGVIAATVLVIINKAMDTVVLWQNKMQAFEIARENMEKILSQPTVTDMFEYGANEINPDITWESKVESFYEPVTNNMWMRAVCVAKFIDSEGEEQKIELTHWLTSLSKEQVQQILEQQARESQYESTLTGDELQTEEKTDPEAAWKEMEKLAGPPPQGYENWGQVPEEEFWKAVMNMSSQKNADTE